MSEYWENKKQLKELYVKAVKDQQIAWHLEYLKEREKRIAIETKYERLARKIKENAIEKVNEREVAEFGKLHKVNFGNCEREVQHIMKKEEK